MFLYPASGLFSDGWAVTINNHNHNKLKSLLVYLFTTVISALGKQEWCRQTPRTSQLRASILAWGGGLWNTLLQQLQSSWSAKWWRLIRWPMGTCKSPALPVMSPVAKVSVWLTSWPGLRPHKNQLNVRYPCKMHQKQISVALTRDSFVSRIALDGNMRKRTSKRGTIWWDRIITYRLLESLAYN